MVEGVEEDLHQVRWDTAEDSGFLPGPIPTPALSTAGTADTFLGEFGWLSFRGGGGGGSI